VIEEVNQALQVSFAGLAPLAERLDGGGSNQRVWIRERRHDHPGRARSRHAKLTQGTDRLTTDASVPVASCFFERGPRGGGSSPHFAESLGRVSAHLRVRVAQRIDQGGNRPVGGFSHLPQGFRRKGTD